MRFHRYVLHLLGKNVHYGDEGTTQRWAQPSWALGQGKHARNSGVCPLPFWLECRAMATYLAFHEAIQSRVHRKADPLCPFIYLSFRKYLLGTFILRFLVSSLSSQVHYLLCQLKSSMHWGRNWSQVLRQMQKLSLTEHFLFARHCCPALCIESLSLLTSASLWSKDYSCPFWGWES